MLRGTRRGPTIVDVLQLEGIPIHQLQLLLQEGYCFPDSFAVFSRQTRVVIERLIATRGYVCGKLTPQRLKVHDSRSSNKGFMILTNRVLPALCIAT